MSEEIISIFPYYGDLVKHSYKMKIFMQKYILHSLEGFQGLLSKSSEEGFVVDEKSESTYDSLCH